MTKREYPEGTRWRLKTNAQLRGLTTEMTLSGALVHSSKEVDLKKGDVIVSRGVTEGWGSDPWFYQQWQDPTGNGINYATLREDADEILEAVE